MRTVSVLWENRTDGIAYVAVVVVPIHIGLVQTDGVCYVGVGRTDVTRPVVAVRACTAVRTAEAVSCSGQEDGIPVLLARHLVAADSIQCGPRPGAF